METFARQLLFIALGGASVVAVTAAQAVIVNSKGEGQVLLYPYYTVRTDSSGNGFVTGLDVVNVTQTVKAVKVRFLEGSAGQDVLDFNLYLSPNDVWTAALIPNASGATLVTFDNSCTVPPIPKPDGMGFTNANYANDPVGGSLDRTREGWVEIIEMGPVTNVAVATAAKHNAAGVPADCALVAEDNNAIGVGPPTGGLFGGETFVNVASGTDYTADPVALDAWRNQALWSAPGGTNAAHPDLNDALPQRSSVLTTTSGQDELIVTGGTSWGGSNTADPVSAVLMHDNVYNEYVLDTSTSSGTDWVLAFPTKRFYYTSVNAVASRVTALFQRNLGPTGACDDMSRIGAGSQIFDREEKITPPAALGSAPYTLCWAANVLTFNSSSVFGSTNSENVSTSNPDGWVDVNFSTASPGSGTVITSNHQLISSGATTLTFNPTLGTVVNSTSSATYFGLPVIGLSVNSYSTGTLVVNGQTVFSAYGGNFAHKYSDQIKTP